MNSLAGAAILVIGGALAGCGEPGAWYDEPAPYRAMPVYGLQLGCSDCRSHYVQPHHHHQGEHRARPDHGKRPEGGKGGSGKGHKRHNER